MQDGGNPYRGMLYGMTAREPMESIPSQLWKVWDAFGIKDSRMMGYWVSYNPVKTGRNDILATSFVKDGKVMIAIASWAKKDSDIKLQIDWEKLGIDADKARLTAPDIKGFQEGFSLSPKDKIKVPKTKDSSLFWNKSRYMNGGVPKMLTRRESTSRHTSIFKLTQSNFRSQYIKKQTY